MPLYDFKCVNGHTFERQVKLANFEDIQTCDCNAVATRLISKPRFSVDQTDYACPVTGERIASKREHEENLKRQNCRVLEPGETESAAKKRLSDDEVLDKKIEETVEREIESYSSAKKEQLSNELVNGGLDVEVVRK